MRITKLTPTKSSSYARALLVTPGEFKLVQKALEFAYQTENKDQGIATKLSEMLEELKTSE